MSLRLSISARDAVSPRISLVAVVCRILCLSDLFKVIWSVFFFFHFFGLRLESCWVMGLIRTLIVLILWGSRNPNLIFHVNFVSDKLKIKNWFLSFSSFSSNFLNIVIFIYTSGGYYVIFQLTFLIMKLIIFSPPSLLFFCNSLQLQLQRQPARLKVMWLILWLKCDNIESKKILDYDVLVRGCLWFVVGNQFVKAPSRLCCFGEIVCLLSC